MEMGPWFYDKALLLFVEPKGDTYNEDMDFRYVSFWVHFHKLSYACFSRSSVEIIGSLLGKVERIGIPENMEPSWKSSLRIKIQIDVTRPLKRGVFMQSQKKR